MKNKLCSILQQYQLLMTDNITLPKRSKCARIKRIIIACMCCCCLVPLCCVCPPKEVMEYITD
jgi:hypothetical protein